MTNTPAQNVEPISVAELEKLARRTPIEWVQWHRVMAAAKGFYAQQAELSRLRAEKAKLREALEPCATLTSCFDGEPNDRVVYGCRHADGSYHQLRVGDLRRARDVLSQTTSPRTESDANEHARSAGIKVMKVGE